MKMVDTSCFRKHRLMKGLLSLVVYVSFTSAHAQKNVGDTAINMTMLNFSYAAQLPGGDLADRFGFNSNLGLSGMFKFSSNWTVGLEGTFLFGREVKEDTILNGLFTSDGNIINNNGSSTRVIANQRGFTMSVVGGKILPLSFAPNTNSGLELKLGVGYMLHKIRYDVEDNNLPQLSDEYKKGYDRLTGGFMTSQYIGYRHFSNNRLVNFFVGIEFMEGFTDSQRSWNYDTNSPGMTDRLDLLYGIRAGWTLPIYKRAPKDIYFY